MYVGARGSVVLGGRDSATITQDRYRGTSLPVIAGLGWVTEGGALTGHTVNGVCDAGL